MEHLTFILQDLIPYSCKLFLLKVHIFITGYLIQSQYFDVWFLFLFWKGEWKHIGSLPFWYDAYLPNGSTSFDAAFSKNGEDSSLMNSMSEFYNNEHNINLSELNETDINSYSVMANLHSTQLSGFSYQFVSGDTNEGKFINYCIIYFHFLLLLASC